MAEKRDFDKQPVQTGSAPIPKPEKKPAPPEKSLHVGENNDEIVLEATQIYEEDLRHQIDNKQTRGKQAGFSNTSVDEIVDK